MSKILNLIVGRAYFLSGMVEDMWTTGHPQFGKPEAVAGYYLGCLQGTRRWHGFEVWAGGKERGVIFMTDEDLSKLRVEPVTG